MAKPICWWPTIPRQTISTSTKATAPSKTPATRPAMRSMRWPRNGDDGNRSRRLPEQWPSRPFQHRFFRRLQGVVPQRWRCRTSPTIAMKPASPRYHSLSRLGRRLHRLRQRRMEGHFHRQRSRLPTGGRSRLGHHLRSAPAVLPKVGSGKFTSFRRCKAPGLRWWRPSRGAAFGDLFNDGHIDVVINNMDATLTFPQRSRYYRRLCRTASRALPSPPPNHWIAFRLIGGPKSPRDAVGAIIYLNANGFRQRADILAGGSFASSSDQRPHFGLGTATKIDAIEIRWPDGTKQAGYPTRHPRYLLCNCRGQTRRADEIAGPIFRF